MTHVHFLNFNVFQTDDESPVNSDKSQLGFDHSWEDYVKSRVGFGLFLTSSRSRIPIFADHIFSSTEATFSMIGCLLDHFNEVDRVSEDPRLQLSLSILPHQWRRVLAWLDAYWIMSKRLIKLGGLTPNPGLDLFLPLLPQDPGFQSSLTRSSHQRRQLLA